MLTGWLPSCRWGGYKRYRHDTGCRHCATRLRVAGSQAWQCWLFALAIVPITLGLIFPAVWLAMEHGVPYEGSYVDRWPIFVIVGVPLVTVPTVLVVRFNGVERA
ncbi:MAG: hypothetical protein AAFS07_07455 [Pseudomonadota bacterium]